jgi:hypothetical protein
MNRDEIIRMAQEAGYVYHVSGGTGTYVQFYWDQLERFADLVAAAERERIKWDTIHSCHPECDKPVCVAIRKAVAEEREAFDAKYPIQLTHDQYNVVINAALKDEREACAELCETLRLFHCEDMGYSELPYKECAFNIRERSAPALERLNKAAEDNGEPL